MNEDRLIESVKAQLLACEWPSNEASYLLAVSGGPDSVCLAYIIRLLLDEITSDERPSVTIAHFDHGLRGEDSAADAAFVEALATDLNLPFVSGKAIPSDDLSGSSETWARQVRHRFFTDERAKISKDCWLLLGHHQDDLIETMIINLSRGSGLTGLASMPPVDYVRKTARPLLNISRNDIITFIKRRDLSYCHDLSNESADTWRNNIRINVIPELKLMFDDRLGDRFYSSNDIFRVEDQYLDQTTESIYKELIRTIRGESGELLYLLIPIDAFRSQHLAIRRRICRQVLSAWQGSNLDITFEAIETFNNYIESTNQTGIDLPGYLRAETTSSLLRVYKKSVIDEYRGKISIPSNTLEADLSESITLFLDKVEESLPILVENDYLTQESLPKGSEKTYNSAYVMLPKQKLSELRIRNRRIGDRLELKSGDTFYHKSLKKFMQERGLWKELRDRIILVCEDELVRWIPGMIDASVNMIDNSHDELTAIRFL